MTRIFAAVRALVYATGFVFLWGWLALQARSIGGGWRLPAGSRVAGTLLMVLGGVLVLCCVAWFDVAGRGTPPPFDPPPLFVARGAYPWVRNPMYLRPLLRLLGLRVWHTS